MRGVEIEGPVLLMVALACGWCAFAEPAGGLMARRTIVNCRPGECGWRHQDGWVRPDEITPGTMPFAAPESVEFEMSTNLPGSVELRLKGETSGRIFAFTSDWQRVTRVVTPLPEGERYRLHDFRFWPAKRRKFAPGEPGILRIDGFYPVTSAEACELDVRTGHPLHVVRSEAERPVFLLKNAADRPLAWTGELRLADFLGHARTIPFKAQVAAGGTHEIKLTGPLPEKGVWQVFGEIRGEDGSVASPKTRFAVLDDHGAPQRLPAGKFRMGVNYHVGRYFSICRTNCNEALMACGAKLVRIALGNWRGAQPKSAKDAYDWTSDDRTLAEMHAIGCDVNAGCWGMPHWAADPEIREKAAKEKDWKVWGMTPPKDTTALEAYYEAAARHFGTKIAYYEIGNEWDLPFFFPGTTEEAVRGLSAAGRALHKGCPGVRVTPCGWACSGDSKMVRNKGIQSNLLVRCKGAYDIHAIHLHGGFKDFRRRVLEGTFPLRKACGVTEPWYANETAVSINHAGELPTAENVWMKILFSWAYGSTDYIWYNLRATGWDPKDSEQGYGMITPDFYPRASFAAFSALSKLLSGFDADGIVRSEADRECFRFKGVRDGVPECVLAGWETAPKNKTRPVRVKTDAQRAYAVDLMGNAREVPVADGVCAWPFGARPSALRLVGATRAEPVAEDVDAKNLPPKVIKVGCGKGRPADLACAKVDDVHNFFEANPGMVHRLWKGPEDCSFRAWFDRTDAKTLTVTVEVTDDVHTQHAEKTALMSQGDCVRLDFEAKGQTGTWFLGFRRTDAGANEPHVWYAANGFDGDKVRREIRFESDRKGAVTTYRVALPIEAMGLGPDPFDGHVKASVKVDDADGDDRDLWMGLDGCWTLQGACADECPRWITIMPLPEQNAAAIAEDAVALGNETLVNGIAYMCNLTPEGDPAADRAAIYAKRYREVEPLVRKASKVKQGVLLQATMGHGYRPGQPTPWQTCVKPNGDSVYRFCPLGPRFLGYVAAQCRTLSDLKPDFFMLDDDTRMVWSDELPGCFCPLHLAALERRTGRKWTREEVIAGLKAKDESLVRTWDEVKFDSLRTFYRTIRANITGTVPGMICVVTSPAHFKHAKEIAEILAAPGQTPTVRGGGAPYHHLGKDLYHVIGQRYAYSRQLAAVGEGVAYMMEADTCPQTLWSTSATREYNELVMMALEGVKGAKIWITRLGNPHERRSQKVYRKAFSENRGIMEWAAKADFRQQGVVIPLDGPVDKNFGDQYLSIMGFPYRFGTARTGEITALTAATVANLARADLERILSGRVLLDGGAAVALAKLGYGKDIGVEATEWQSAPAQAHRFEDGFVQNGIGRGSLVDLNRHDPKAQVLTRILHRPHMGAELAPVNPGSILFENARGGRVLTLAQTLPPQQAWYFESDMQSETYKTQMARWLRRLADGVPGGVFYRGDGPVMCEAGTTSAGERIVVLDVLDLDGDDAPDLVFEQMPSRIERLQGDGSWRAVSFVRDGDACRLESPVLTQRPAIFRISSDGAKPDLTVRPEAFTEKASRTRPWARRTNPLFALDAEGVDDIHLAYADEQPPVLVLSNRTDSALALAGGIRLSGIGGGEVRAFDASGILPAGGVRRFPVGKGLAKGVWSAVAELETPDARAVSETRFGVVRRRSVTPPSAPGEFRAGFNYHMARYTDADNAKCLKALVQSGAKLVRAGICTGFGTVEGQEGVFDWSRADRYLGQLEQSGLAVDAFIHGAPKWALDDRYLRIRDRPGSWAAPSRPGLLEDYARALASRYGTRIAWYEVGNEWDLIDPEILTTDEAIRLQKEAYRGIKAGCPEAKVIPNGWAVVHSDVIPHRTQRDMQERMMTEAVDFYDAHPVHQHGPYREYRRRLAEFFAWRKAKGIVRKPWYSNETAQTTSNVGEELVAECVWQKILHAWAHGSVDYIWYNLRAIGFGPYDGESGYGVVTGDFYPRATYAAFAGLTSCFEGLKADGIVHEGESRDLYRFAGNGRTVLVGWDLRATSNSVIRIRTDAKRAFAADPYDNRTEVPVAGGEVAFTIGRTPAALILEGATSAVPDEEDLRRGERKEVLDIVLGGKGHHFTLHDYDGVFEMYKADPANFDKVWKGWWDLIADIDVSVADGRLKILAKTNDEKLAADDALVVSVDGKETRFPVAEPREKGAIYRGDVPCPSADSIIEIRIEDDDGLGREGWITTGRFRIRPDAKERKI